jgi:hypothetical protein
MSIKTLLAAGIFQAVTASSSDVLQLNIPPTAQGASIEHAPSFSSFSFE